MKTVPFLAFSAGEQAAVLRLLQEAGVGPGRACVSRLEFAVSPQSPQVGTLTIVSTPRWCRTFSSIPDADWLSAFARELPQA